MKELISKRISECVTEAAKYERWLGLLRFPNLVLVGGGSLLAFIGGAAIIAEKATVTAGYMALIGGALTGMHGWMGCETHQQKCRAISSAYSAMKRKYESLLVKDKIKEEEFRALESQYAEFIEKIDTKPWF